MYRRQRGDLIQMYKVVSNIDHINWHNKPILRPLNVRHRGHFVGEMTKKLRNAKPNFHKSNHKSLKLGDHIVEANTVTTTTTK